MYFLKFIILLVISTVAVAHPLDSEDKLESVVVLFRHGDRTPNHQPYPNDPYRNRSVWPVGFGELTNLGKIQQYELGQWLRARYNGFLPAIYSEEDIYVFSSDKDRCSMSAGTTLAGLYPPVESQVWNKDLLWQPIPIHTFPNDQDPYVYQGKACPKWDDLMADLLATEYFVNYDKNNSDLYKLLTEKLGINVTTFNDVTNPYDALRVEELFNFTLPEWTHGVYPEKLKPLAELIVVINAYTPALARLSNGPLLDEILSRLQNNRTVNNVDPKFGLISGHQTNLADILINVLQANVERHIPSYSSAVMFELYNNPEGEKHVKVFYKRSHETKEAEQLKLKFCDLNCNFDTLLENLTPLRLDIVEWDQECNVKDK